MQEKDEEMVEEAGLAGEETAAQQPASDACADWWTDGGPR